ncbi:glycoside hydrolase family 43 protein [Paenibacillus sp. Leaf72]|uniref:glycoside hydrolase family 43 protein n=1 Tax=Paenibacillus sp. Leaf72 TaxID=1736234 RepID=UPI0006FFF705|nr:glycoside hydrolase family 43 protein [Paenibacillus sp. Leaf72]KQO12734.1 xylan 1,4-beta-xylosidase [Paenibacillus sp. Leaf72]
MKFSNPVLSGCYPDPSICRVGNDYYLVNSSFNYYPGIPIFHSSDLVNWTQIGHVLTRESQLPLGTKTSGGGAFSFTGIYAPTLRYRGGRFYLITTNVQHGGNFIVTADRPEGPWSEPVWLEWGGIDPSLMFDEDGKVYVTGTGGGDELPGIYQAEMDPDTGAILTERRLIWEGTGGSYPEGPHLYRIADWYYLLIAEGGTEFGHMVTIARSKEPYGPFQSCPSNPILSNRSTGLPIQATGHADFVEAHDGSWWAVYLGIRPLGYPFYHHLGRETFLIQITWSDDGWPVIGYDGKAQLEIEGPSFYEGSLGKCEGICRDDFNSESLNLHWNYLRNPVPEAYSLTRRPGWLTLLGMEQGLDGTERQTFVGQRQRHLECKVSALLDFEPTRDGEEAGLTIYMNEKGHYEIAVTRIDGVKTVLFRRRIGSLWKVEREETIPVGSILLSIAADATTYVFAFTLNGKEETELGRGECFYLSSEVAGGFTGVYVGLYASGNGIPSDSPAQFDYFDYRTN